MLKTRSASKKRLQLPHRYHVKRGDLVMVIAGKDKGKTGVITRVFRSKGKVLIDGINIVKKAVRPNPLLGQRGGIVEMPAPLNVSKVMLYDANASKASRYRTEIRDGNRVRVLIKTNEPVE